MNNLINFIEPFKFVKVLCYLQFGLFLHQLTLELSHLDFFSIDLLNISYSQANCTSIIKASLRVSKIKIISFKDCIVIHILEDNPI